VLKRSTRSRGSVGGAEALICCQTAQRLWERGNAGRDQHIFLKVGAVLGVPAAVEVALNIDTVTGISKLPVLLRPGATSAAISPK